MTPYRIQEADLLIPSEWVDQSLTVLKIPKTNVAAEASFLISRDSRDKNSLFEDYMSLQLQQSKSQLPKYQLKKDERLDLQGIQCGWLEYTWDNGSGTLYIRQVFYDLGSKVLITTLTTTPADVEHHDSIWRQVMRSLKLLPIPQETAPDFPFK